MSEVREMERDVPAYPRNGVIYDGDYYGAIPYAEYIKRRSVEELQKEYSYEIYDILDYGAVADDYILSTEAFQAAADAARDAGGGIVYVHGGHYCMGSVKIFSNTILFIETDAAIVASRNPARHKDAFLTLENAENSCLTGGGMILCNGEYFVHLPKRRPLRTPMEVTKVPPVLYDKMGYPVDTIRYAYRSRIRYAADAYGEGAERIPRPMYSVWAHNCRNLHIWNIIIKDAMDWSLCIDQCKHVSIEDLVIDDNRHVANTDGIDIMGSRDVDIHHCFVSSADDGICIKAPKNHMHDELDISDPDMEMGGCSNVRIQDCTVVSVMNAFKIGTETYYDIEDIKVENCKFMLPDIYPGMVSGISIVSCDGSVIKNVSIENVEMSQVVCPVFIGLNMRNKYGAVDGRGRETGGMIQGIRISRIRAEQAELPSIITGFETVIGQEKVERRVKDIELREIYVKYRNNQEDIMVLDEIYENVSEYPESNAFGDVPAYGIYIRHADQVFLDHFVVIPRDCNTRECIVSEKSDVRIMDATVV